MDAAAIAELGESDVKVKIQKLQHLSCVITFADIDGDSEGNLHRQLFDRLSSSSLKSIAELNFDTMEVRTLSNLIKTLTDTLPIITLGTDQMTVNVRTKSIEVEVGNEGFRSIRRKKLTQITKKSLLKSSEILTGTLLALSGLTEIAELDINCIATFLLEDKIGSLGHLLSKFRVDASKELGFRLDLRRAEFAFDGMEEPAGTDFELLLGPEMKPFETIVEGSVWRCRMKTRSPLVSINLYEFVQDIVKFSGQAIKMLGL